MAKSHLRACLKCARHVRVSEVACPFCGDALSEAFRASPAPLPPRARLSRAALFAFGTGTATLASAGALTSACSSATSAPAPAYGSAPAYGGVFFDSGSVDSGEFTNADAYGGLPVVDSGPLLVDAADDAPAIDSGPVDSGQFMVSDAYGMIPSEAGHDAGEDAPVEIFDAAYGAPPTED
jgi:hypothetical protein